MKVSLALAASIFLTLILLLTQSPTAIGGIIVAALLFFIVKLCWKPGRKWLLLLGGFLILLLLVLIGPTLVTNVTQLLPPSTGEPTQRIVFRLEMWLRAVDMFKDKPFTGIGLNNFPSSIFIFYPTYSLGPEAHAHNILLQTAVDGGITGLAGLVTVLVGLTVTVGRAWQVQENNRQARALLVGITIGTLAWLFYGVAESITLAHKPALILWLMWSLAAVLAFRPPEVVKKEEAIAVETAQSHNHAWLYSSRYSLFAIGIAAILLIGLFWWGGWSRLGQNLAIIEGQKAFLSNKPAEIRAATIKLQKEALKPDSYLSSATLDLAARLAAAQNDFPSSATYLFAEISQDSHNTTAKYIPADWLLWKQLRPVASEPLLRLYSQWKARYSTDPISYSRLALAYAVNCQSKQAQTVLGEGQSRISSPLLQYLENNLPVKC